MILSVHIVPNASRSEIVGWMDGALKIRLAAPPVDGKANETLVRFLADKLDLSPSEISIAGGHASKRKRIDIPLADKDVKNLLLS